MTFALSKLAWDLLRPTMLLLLLSWAGMALIWTRYWRAGRLLATIGLGGCALVIAVPIHAWLLLPLEDRIPRPPAPARVDGIVVLSGALEPALSRDRGIPSLNAAAERMTGAMALAVRYPQARVVFTGASSDIVRGGPTEAGWARRLFISLGLDPARLTTEDAARNSYENAVNTRRLVHPMPGQCWLLVTSARHMPRAVGVFRHIGWPVTPWPVAYKSGHSLRVWLSPALGERLADLDAAAHEWVGLLAYRLLGRTDALFPGPRPADGCAPAAGRRAG